ncbi:hypothetical protein JW905_18150 [bacterium]|nr:hypothetical protein [candidate division CSSED10-310 bacterium]
MPSKLQFKVALMNTNADIPILEDILSLCSFIAEHAPPVVTPNHVSEEVSRALGSQLQPEPMVFERILHTEYWLQFLFETCLNSGLIVAQNGSYHVGPSCEYFLSLDTPSRIRFLESGWIVTEPFNEWCMIPRAQIELLKRSKLNKPECWRRSVMDVVAGFPPNQWVATPELLERLRFERVDFFRCNPRRYRFNPAETWRCRSYLPSWENNEARLVCFLLKYPLRWLGYVKVSDGKDMSLAKFINPSIYLYLCKGYPTRFMVTDSGVEARRLERLHRPAQPADKRFKVDGENRLIVTARPTEEDRLHMELLTVESDGSRKCTPEAVWKALDAGIEAESIRYFFEARALAGEEFLRILKEEWLPRFGELVIVRLPILIVVRPANLNRVLVRLAESEIPAVAISECAVSIPEAAGETAKLALKESPAIHVDRFGSVEVMQARTTEVMDRFVVSEHWRDCVAKRMGPRHALLKSRVWRRCYDLQPSGAFSIIMAETQNVLDLPEGAAIVE